MKKILPLVLGSLLAMSSIAAQAETYSLRFHSKGLNGTINTGAPGGGSAGPVETPSSGNGGSGGTGGTGGNGGTGTGTGGSGNGSGGQVEVPPVETPPVETLPPVETPAPGYSLSQFSAGMNKTTHTLINNTGEMPSITNCLRTPPGGTAVACTAKDSWPLAWPVGVGLQGVEGDNTYRVYLGNGQVIVWVPQSDSISFQ